MFYLHGVHWIVASLALMAQAQTKVDARWSKYGLSPSAIAHLQEEKVYCDPSAPGGCQFEKDDRFLQLRQTQAPNERAAIFVRERELTAIRSLYESQKTPYPGQITTLQQCDKELSYARRSLKTAGGEVPIFIGGASQRRVFGSCTKGEVFYIGFQTGIYSPNGYLRLTGFQKLNPAKTWTGQIEELERWARELIP